MLEFLSKEKYRILDSVSSTNDYIKDKDLFLVIANSQTGGKGTNNRSFFSPSGGIYLSVKVDIKTENLPFVTAYTAVAVLKALDNIGLVADIKWVNDIYINGSKLGGILAESVIKGKDLSTVIIGIGLNLKKQNFPNLNLNTPTSIEGELGYLPSKEEIITRIVKEFLALDKDIESKEFLSTYKTRSCLIGKTVQINQGGKLFDGKVVSINDDVSINIDINGKIKNFYNGDIKIIL